MAVSEFQSTSLELALPLLDLGLLLAQLEDEDAELALQHVDLALRQPLLPPLQQPLLRPLLQGSARQLLLPGPQLLRRGDTASAPRGIPALQASGLRPKPGRRPRLALSALWSSQRRRTF